MASLMEDLVETLDRECTEYEGLLDISRCKTPIIIKGDLEQLQKITDDEQERVGRITHYDHKRTVAMKDIATVLGKDASNMKLSDLIDTLGKRPAEQQRLAELHDRLKNTVRELKRVNEQNGELLRNSLEMVEFEVNLFQASRTAPETANYNRGAYNAGSTMGVTHGFDAKQ